jgi:hypothetical protein
MSREQARHVVPYRADNGLNKFADYRRLVRVVLGEPRQKYWFLEGPHVAPLEITEAQAEECVMNFFYQQAQESSS